MVEVDEQVLEDLYAWIDEMPLSRPKKDLKRDFSDGVLVAEVVKYFHPHLVEIHNYTSAHSISKKTVNWNILNRAKQSAGARSGPSVAVASGRCVGNEMMVPKTLYDETLQEMLTKDETIQILQAKIQRLEHLVQLKDIRIEDLQTRLNNLAVTAVTDFSPDEKHRSIRR